LGKGGVGGDGKADPKYKAGAVELKKRPPTRVLCTRVKEIRSIFLERTTKADASPKQKEGVKKTPSLS
jgi:hypothetical protein